MAADSELLLSYIGGSLSSDEGGQVHTRLKNDRAFAELLTLQAATRRSSASGRRR